MHKLVGQKAKGECYPCSGWDEKSRDEGNGSDMAVNPTNYGRGQNLAGENSRHIWCKTSVHEHEAAPIKINTLEKKNQLRMKQDVCCLLILGLKLKNYVQPIVISSQNNVSSNSTWKETRLIATKWSICTINPVIYLTNGCANKVLSVIRGRQSNIHSLEPNIPITFPKNPCLVPHECNKCT